MFFTMTMSCLIVFIYLKRRISILALLVSELLLFVFLVYVIKTILVLNIPSVHKSQPACTRPSHRYRYSMSKFHKNDTIKNSLISCKSG